MNCDGLKQAARDYLKAIEDADAETVTNAKDKLAEIAVLWAQGEAIEKVDLDRARILERFGSADEQREAKQFLAKAEPQITIPPNTFKFSEAKPDPEFTGMMGSVKSHMPKRKKSR